MYVFRSMVLNAPLSLVWDQVRRFDGVAAWNPGVSAARMEEGNPTQVGAVRHLDIADGSVFRETLLAHSDQEHFYAYDILESPLPLSNYKSCHRFIEVTHSNQTLGIWDSHFDCDTDKAEKLGKIVGDGIYIAAMEGLNTHLEKLKNA